ncbi:MAG: hypothetical protein IPM93_25295 [Candidatus Obscuribacter sp.]|nr:hypothetical protein [Candidatus Obscuribacter sp.]
MRKALLIIYLSLFGVCLSAEAKSGFETVQVIKHVRCPRSDWPPHNYVPPVTYPTGGLFFELEDGQVCFITSAQYRRLRASLEDGTKESSEKFLFWNPKTRSKRTLRSEIRFMGEDCITVNGKPVTRNSLERLRLSKEWEKVLKGTWPVGCSIVNLGKGRFLISGGLRMDPYGTGPLFIQKASVYNSQSNSVEKTLPMLVGRAFHSSILLDNGTVFCVGGEAENMIENRTNSAEIVDIRKERIIGVGDRLPIGLAHATICKDTEGNPIIFGGKPYIGFSSKSIIRFDLASGKFDEAGTLKVGRHCVRTARTLPGGQEVKLTHVIENYVERLSTGQYILDGGVCIEPSAVADFASGDRDDAEILRIRKD